MGYGPVNVPGSADGGDISNAKSTFSEESSRANITSGEKLSTIFGKIKKWYTDLKTVAWTGSYSDLKDTPESMTPKAHATSATTYGKGDASNYGHLKLSDSTASTSSTTGGIAATPKAVKEAYDLAASKSRTATLVVAASNSSTKSKAAADYTCTGSSDQFTINSAISALPTGGGKIELLDGTYNLGGMVTVNKAKVMLEGVGMGATMLQITTSHGIRISADNCTICNLTVACPNGTPLTGKAGYFVEGKRCVLNNVEASGFAYGISNGGSNMMVTSSHFHNNGSGIYVGGTKANIWDSLFENNDVGVSFDGHFNLVENNRIIDNGIGIQISSYSEAHHNKFHGNYIIRGTGQASDYTSSQYTIKIDSGNNNVVADNYIPGKNYVNNGGNTNTFSNNVWHAAKNVASGEDSFAAGRSNVASGLSSFVCNFQNTASGICSFAAGNMTTASGDYSFAFGTDNTALNNQFKLGHHATDGNSGGFNGTTGDALIIGNGSTGAKSNSFRVTHAGQVYGKSAFNSTGADYAELFEWADGNPDGVDRIGLFVTIDGDKIRIANENDYYILGAVSGAPGVVGNNHADTWQGMWMTDVFGRVLTHTVHHEAEYEDREIKTPRGVINDETGEITVEYDITTEHVLIHDEYDAIEPIINPDYDPDEKYIPREERPEWGIVGMMGQLIVIDDGTCVVNGNCTVGDGGIATASESGWRVIARLDETHVKVLFR